jgi:hypothetical protein
VFAKGDEVTGLWLWGPIVFVRRGTGKVLNGGIGAGVVFVSSWGSVVEVGKPIVVEERVMGVGLAIGRERCVGGAVGSCFTGWGRTGERGT